MPTFSLPDKPELSEVEILLLRQVAGGRPNKVVSRVTGIAESAVGSAVTALTFKLGTPHRHRAAALGVGWGWVRIDDVPVLIPVRLPLPVRQQEVLVALIRGEAPTDTAQRLCLTDSTVRTYVQNIISRLTVRSRAEAAALALLTEVVPLSALGEGWPEATLGQVHGSVGSAPQLIR